LGTHRAALRLDQGIPAPWLAVGVVRALVIGAVIGAIIAVTPRLTPTPGGKTRPWSVTYHGEMAAPTGGFGGNDWLVEEMYERYLDAPGTISDSWRSYFEGNGEFPVGYGNRSGSETALAPPPPSLPTTAAARTAPPATPPVQAAPAPAPPTPPPSPAAAPPAAASPAAPSHAGAPPGRAEILKGAAATIADRMAASRVLPTATSVRTFPAKLLEVNRTIINNQLARRAEGGKVSFTHLIGWAVIRALGEQPAMNAAYTEIDGKPARIAYEHINLGLAMDLPRKGGGRTLLVPNLKQVDELDFKHYWQAYEEVVSRVRSGSITPDDFAGTTATLTNPGTVGTVQSVPRLMPDQGVIVGVGRIGYPPEYEGADPESLARIGMGRTLTMTSTYDHRIIQGAESGMFLARVHGLLLGEDGFYDEIFRSMEVPYVPVRWAVDSNPAPGSQGWAEKQARIFQLINMYRVRGHLIADLDPLRQQPPKIHDELDPISYGLSLWDLDREFATGGLAGRLRMPLGEILGVLRNAYCRTSGIEYMHIQEPDQKLWIQEHAERPAAPLTIDEKRRILDKLVQAESFERFLHTKFLGAKRFSLEGAESLIPLLDVLLNAAADSGVEDVVLGMAHRGRLNVLANTARKDLATIFYEFVGHEEPDDAGNFSGDVKYHLGADGVHVTPDGREVGVEVAANPSHLEAVDPVLVGIARARQDEHGPDSDDIVLPVLLHGDAAFAGQGVVAETFNLSQLRGYSTGGTVHVVVNNQVGFTTAAVDARSSFYATDVAKNVQAPIFHVNGDDPEAVLRVTRMAFAFREAFHKDVVIDLVCYRRLGHNEGDEPSYTQPSMYRIIDGHPPVRQLYAERLVDTKEATTEEVEGLAADYRAELETALAASREITTSLRQPRGSSTTPISTRVGAAEIEDIETSLHVLPDGFAVHPKLSKLLDDRHKLYEGGLVDWALGEALAFGTLSMEGVRVRLAGEDSQRGTFSHRHAVLVDYQTEEEHTPLQHLHPDQAPITIYDSLLSEFAAMGFEYGYSVAAPDALVLWEAQYGDFVNGAQVVIDQFLVSGLDKWDQTCGLGLLLPHGFEGNGPEHSSARLERFLQNAADDNIRVAVPSTPAQYFHLLRRQALHPEKRPLIVMSPKSLLRTRDSYSPVADLTEHDFREVLGDTEVTSGARRVLLCSGKIYYELVKHRQQHGLNDVAVVRTELLYPFPAEALAEVLAPYGDTEVLWVQEEPANMGAWRYMSRSLFVEGGGRQSRGLYRRASASPATGNPNTHAREQREIIEKAFA